MERLIFTNAIGQQIEFKSSGTYRWTQVSGLNEADIDLQTAKSPFQDGSTPVGSGWVSTKTIKIDIVIVSDNIPDAIREINKVLNPKLGNGSLTYEVDGVGKVLSPVRTRIMPTKPGGKSRGLGFQISSMVLEAYNPYFKDEAYTEADVTTGANVFSFPLNITDSFVFDYLNEAGVTVTNSGDVDCPVTIILDGPKTSPIKVENVTTGEKITLSLDLIEGERLTITTEIDNLNVIKTNLTTGQETVAFQYIDTAETDFFYLTQGINTIKISANEAEVEEATIKYKNQFIGV